MYKASTTLLQSLLSLLTSPSNVEQATDLWLSLQKTRCNIPSLLVRRLDIVIGNLLGVTSALWLCDEISLPQALTSHEITLITSSVSHASPGQFPAHNKSNLCPQLVHQYRGK